MGEIVARVFFHTTYDFVIDFSVWLAVWAVLLLGGPLLAEGGHVSVEFVREKLRGKSRLFLEAFNSLCTLTYGAVIALGGVLLVRSLYVKKAVCPRYFAIPMWVVELCVPIAMLIFTLYAVVEFYKVLRRKW